MSPKHHCLHRIKWIFLHISNGMQLILIVFYTHPVNSSSAKVKNSKHLTFKAFLSLQQPKHEAAHILIST